MASRWRFLLFILILLSCTTPVAVAAHHNTEDFAKGRISMDDLRSGPSVTAQQLRKQHQTAKKKLRLEQRITRFEKMIARKWGNTSRGGFSDPVNKFFWYWVTGWGAGLLLTLLAGGAITSGGLAILWFTLFVGGAVSLVLWLVKRFG